MSNSTPKKVCAQHMYHDNYFNGECQWCILEERFALQAENAKLRSDIAVKDAALFKADEVMRRLFWTSDDGITVRDGAPDDNEAPSYFIEAWNVVRCAQSANPPVYVPGEIVAKLVEALEAIASMQPKPIDDPFPADWSAQIAACPECQSYKNHPIQNGICNLHRKPIWERERREKQAEGQVKYHMRDTALEALALARPFITKGKRP